MKEYLLLTYKHTHGKANITIMRCNAMYSFLYKSILIILILLLIGVSISSCTKSNDYSSVKSNDFKITVPTSWTFTTNKANMNGYITSQKVKTIRTDDTGVNSNLLYLASNGINSSTFPAILIYTLPKGDFTAVNNVAKYNSDIWQNEYDGYKILSYNFPNDNYGIFEFEGNYIISDQTTTGVNVFFIIIENNVIWNIQIMDTASNFKTDWLVLSKILTLLNSTLVDFNKINNLQVGVP